jgi:hypothetical protein
LGETRSWSNGEFGKEVWATRELGVDSIIILDEFDEAYCNTVLVRYSCAVNVQLVRIYLIYHS